MAIPPKSKERPRRKGEAAPVAIPDVAKMFRDLRIAKGYTQGVLADMLGIHLNTLGGWERGVGRVTAECLVALQALPVNRKKPPLRGGPRPARDETTER